uniref:Uncharacterized protein n=1 Tax=Arundo donax TaxID=35708 RepID=A0A0A9H9J1_ARUDO
MRFDLWQQGWALVAIAPSVLIKDRTVVGHVEQVLNVLVTCCCVGNSKSM